MAQICSICCCHLLLHKLLHLPLPLPPAAAQTAATCRCHLPLPPAAVYGTNKWDEGWRLSLGLAGVPAVVLLLGGILLPESPNSLIER